MTRRKDCRAKVFTSQQEKGQNIDLNGDLFILFSMQGHTFVQLNQTQETQLEEQHLLQLRPNSADTCYCSGEAWIGILISYI
jgi:hypothetical protein